MTATSVPIAQVRKTSLRERFSNPWGRPRILALIPRLIQPPLLVLAHRMEKRWKNRPPGGGPPPVTEGRPSGMLSAVESGPSPLRPTGV